MYPIRAATRIAATVAITAGNPPPDLAASLNNLGLLAADQGDFLRAGECYERALAIREKLAPGSLNLASSLHIIGVIFDRLAMLL